MKITKRQLRRIIKEEKARILAEQQLDPKIAAEALTELKSDGWFNMIQTAATDAAGDLEQLSGQVDVKLMDAGLNELAIDIRNVVELLDKIRQAAYDQR
tara:strand:+ start:45 stop:341 length:297 start_codon:yes stop_codon:yes gene_type:complete